MSSGLFPAGPNATRFVGAVSSVSSLSSVSSVSSVIVLDDGGAIFDVYSRNGPEFAAFDSDGLGDRSLLVGTALEVTVLGLCIYPTNT